MSDCQRHTLAVPHASVSGPHDKLFRYAFSDVEEAAPLLRSVLPADLAARVEWSTLKLVPGSFVDEALSDRHTDLLFQAKVDGQLYLLYLLVEHQSTVDPLMAFRMFRYLGRIWDRWLSSHPKEKVLPEVIPVVIFTGTGPWTAPTALEDLVDGRAGPWVPRMKFVLDDLSAVSDQALTGRSLRIFGQLTLLALSRLRTSSDPIGVFRGWSALIERLLAARSGLERFVALLEYLTRVANVELEDVQDVVRQVGPGHEEKVMTTLAERMEKAALEKGLAKGRHEKAVELILRQLNRRFGPVSGEIATVVKGGTEADFERWSDRLLDARHLEQVFSDEPLT